MEHLIPIYKEGALVIRCMKLKKNSRLILIVLLSIVNNYNFVFARTYFMLLGGSYAAPASANCVCTLVGNPPCGTTTNEVLNKP